MYSKSWNPPNRFDSTTVEWDEEPPPHRLQVVEDATRGILSHNDSPDVGFDWSVNPYRGCTHACAYCYARPTHEYLGYGAGSDFERVIVVKRRAPELLEEAFAQPAWRGALVAFSGVTDCYQPLERRYGLTRGCLEVCVAWRNPVQVLTRSPLVARDADLLGQLAALGAAWVAFSIPILDPEACRALEPGTAPPTARLQAMRVLAEAGVPVGVSVSPVIPGLNDRTVPATLQAAREAGATFAWSIDLRLPGAVADVFPARLREALPERAESVLARVRRQREGRWNDGTFHGRMRATGVEADAARRLFHVWHQRLGFGPAPSAPDPTPFRRAPRGPQLPLFGT